jgi:hypothetical protein
MPSYECMLPQDDADIKALQRLFPEDSLGYICRQAVLFHGQQAKRAANEDMHFWFGPEKPALALWRFGPYENARVMGDMKGPPRDLPPPKEDAPLPPEASLSGQFRLAFTDDMEIEAARQLTGRATRAEVVQDALSSYRQAAQAVIGGGQRLHVGKTLETARVLDVIPFESVKARRRAPKPSEPQ